MLSASNSFSKKGGDRKFCWDNSERLPRNIRNLPDGFLITADALSNAMNTPIDVALFLWNPDVIQLMSWLLHHRNLKSCGVEPSEGEDKIENMIASCSPSVVMFDLDPPYDVSAKVAWHLLARFPNLPFVITCADSALAVKKAPWLSGHILFQKPYEMDTIANTVHSMVSHSRQNVAVLSVGA
jgi:hypothetical protein